MKQHNAGDFSVGLTKNWRMVYSRLHNVVDSTIGSDESDANLGLHRLPIDVARMAIINHLGPDARFIPAAFTAEQSNGVKIIRFYPKEALNGITIHDVGISGGSVTELANRPAAGVAVHFTRNKLGAAFLDSEGNPFQATSNLTAAGLALAALPKALA